MKYLNTTYLNATLKYLVLMFNLSLAVQIVIALDGVAQGNQAEIVFLRLVGALVFANLGILFVKVFYNNVYLFDFVAIINNLALIVVCLAGFFYYGFNNYIFSLDGTVTALPSLYYFYRENKRKTAN